MKKFLLLMLLGCSAAFGQTQLTMVVNGAANPDGIQDSSAYTMVFREMVANTQTPQSVKIARVGFTDPDDVAAFQNTLNQFQAQYLSMTANQQWQLASSLETELNAALTTAGQQQFQAYSHRYKKQMATWVTSDFRCGPTCANCTGVTTSYDVIENNYGDPSSAWEDYGDGIGSTGDCSCTLSVYTSVTYNGVVTGGNKQGNNSTVTLVIPNGGTYIGGGVGVVYQTTFTFVISNSCTGTLASNTWEIQSEIAKTRGLYTGDSFGCVTDQYGVTKCSFDVANWCYNTTTPDLNLTGTSVWDLETPAYSYWDEYAACLRIAYSNGYTSPWGCSHGLAIGGKDPAAPQIKCTWN